VRSEEVEFELYVKHLSLYVGFLGTFTFSDKEEIYVSAEKLLI
jgi:hypothetical protein